MISGSDPKFKKGHYKKSASTFKKHASMSFSCEVRQTSSNGFPWSSAKTLSCSKFSSMVIKPSRSISYCSNNLWYMALLSSFCHPNNDQKKLVHHFKSKEKTSSMFPFILPSKESRSVKRNRTDNFMASRLKCPAGLPFGERPQKIKKTWFLCLCE